MYSFWRLYSMGDLIKWIFSNTVKCVRKCGDEWVKAVTTYTLPWAPQALSAALISIILSSSFKPVFIGLSSYITCHNTATCNVCKRTALYIEYPVHHSHSAHVTLRCIQNLNGFFIGFFCSHSADNMMLLRILLLPINVGLAQAHPNDPYTQLQ